VALLSRMVVAVVALAALPAASAAQSDTAGLGASIRQLVIESLNGGGTRGDQVLVAADSASAALLSVARISVVTAPSPSSLLCPGSTELDAKAVQAPVGYVVRVVLSTGADSTERRIHVSKRCKFRYRGGGRGFEETATWQLRLRNGRWLVVRMLESSIT